MQVSIFLCQWKSCCVENCCQAQVLDIRFDFLLRRHYMLCLFQWQSDSAPTRTYWSSRGTAGRNSPLQPWHFLPSFPSSAILNYQAGYRCTLVPRLPFPVPRSPFPVPGISNIRRQTNSQVIVSGVSSRREKLRLVVYKFFSCSTNIPRGLSAYKP